jgi:8-hydroxy-5-deazaflavin:NADPH oxidoreductase
VITAIIGVGNIGSPLARHLVDGYQRVVLASKDESRAQALAHQLGPLARASSVHDAIAGADVVVFAVWFDTIKELIAQYARLLENKIVVDPSNPLRFGENGQMIRTLPADQSAGSVIAALLPAGARFVKAFGTLGADAFANAANREPRAVLFYATDDDAAATMIEQLIRTAGFTPLKAGGVADAARIEMPGGDLHQFGSLNGELVDLEHARAALAARKVAA